MFLYNSLQHGILEFKTFKRAQKHFSWIVDIKSFIENITLVTQLNVNPTACILFYTISLSCI